MEQQHPDIEQQSLAKHTSPVQKTSKAARIPKMKTFAIATFLSALGVASAIPGVSPAKLAARDPSDDPRGSYTISGLGTRKQQVTAAGANTLGLAVAMLETDTMSSDYTYGDGKTEDSANFGIFKQNWGMLRVCCSQFQGQSQDSWNNGAALK